MFYPWARDRIVGRAFRFVVYCAPLEGQGLDDEYVRLGGFILLLADSQRGFPKFQMFVRTAMMRNHKVPVGVLSFQCRMIDQDIFDNGSTRRVLCAELNELLNQHCERCHINRITLEELDAALVYGTDVTVWSTYRQHLFIWSQRVLQEVLQLYPAEAIPRKKATGVSELSGELDELDIANKSLQVVGCIETGESEEICEARTRY